MKHQTPHDSLDRWRFRLLLNLCQKTLHDKTPLKGASVLDMGTGGGRESCLFLMQEPSIYIALDHDPSLMKDADANVREFTQVRFLFADAHFLPLKERSLDVVVLSEALHHVASPYRCIEEAIRVARKFIIIEDAHKSKCRDVINYLLIKCRLKREIEKEGERKLTFRIDLTLLRKIAMDHHLAMAAFPFFSHTFDIWFARTKHRIVRNAYLGMVIILNRFKFIRIWGNRVIVLLVRK